MSKLKKVDHVHILSIPQINSNDELASIMDSLRKAGLPKNVIITNLQVAPIPRAELESLLTRLLENVREIKPE
jgi:hypothetical protein